MLLLLLASASASTSSTASTSSGMTSTKIDSVPIDDETINLDDDDDDEVIELGGKKTSKRQRKLSSIVWNYFIKEEGKNNKRTAKCKACGKSYAADSKYGTGNMKRHIPVCPRKNSRDIGQSLISLSDGSLVNVKFDMDVFRELIAMAVIMHDLPFQFVEWEGMKKLLCYLKPDFHIISRNTCRADCIMIFNREKNQVKSMLESTLGKIFLTSDCWSSLTTDGYICLTEHFIGKDWQLQKRILNFCYMPPPHSVVALCDKIHNFICSRQIDMRIFSIILDNAAANDICADLLKNLLLAKGELLNKGNFFHMRCSAHILNLIVQDGLKEIDESILKIRENSKRGLRQDVPTRWNSTYLMIYSALFYQNAFVHLQLSDSNFKHCPSIDEWKKVEKICKFLRVFNDITCLFSRTKYPTANMYFPLVFSAHLTLNEGIASEDAYVKSIAEKMLIKFNKYWAEYSIILVIAVILDPRYKLSFVEWCYKKIYGDEGGASSTKFMQRMEDDANYAYGAKDVLKEFDSLEFDELTPQKNELELYLEEPRMDRRIKLDILAYWKGNQYRYPHVAAMAHDTLAIPVTTVASESAFSNSGRVLDQYRSALKPEVVEALVCSRDWLLENQDAKLLEVEELTKDIMELNLESEFKEDVICPPSSSSKN
ncbi:zinc finger BED domain-containing protein RICESLEEPER 2-like [Mercurialis annua]|uniref:zinc finger BED domain-containing protein RICESLEEPER 2-like n=1 Tax=Mercurialis annua TaxID=3986 RepID=UPI002160665F|nr:zinc finger BED domain-containing protein RICESLEEPER 2-like [Mercurialis annua]